MRTPTARRRRGRWAWLTAVMALLLGLSTLAVVDTQDADAASPFTIAVLPDTQRYLEAGDPDWSGYFQDQVDWVTLNASSRDIAFVSHVGDVVQNSQNQAEWSVAGPLFDQLDASALPWGVSPGNHDMLYDRTSPAFDQWVPTARFDGKAWYGGNLNGNMNSYQLVTVDGVDLLFLHVSFLGYGTPDAEIAWAAQVLAAHPDRLAFVTTHEFTGLDGSVLQPRLRDEAINPACNVAMVFSGHIHGQGRGSFVDSCGRTIHHALGNYQHLPNGGNGYLRLYDVNPTSRQISATTYSPSLDSYLTDGQNQFSVVYEDPGGGGGGGTETEPVPFGSQWRYFDDGPAPTEWSSLAFDDAGWDTGSTEMGFGDGDESTVLSRTHGGTGLTTAYFRTSFTVTDPAAITRAQLDLLADDGAVVWLNGQRVVNDNITSGPVDYTTLSDAGRWGAAETTPQQHLLSLAALRPGTNSLAIEVHQRDPWSSDLSFDARLRLTMDGSTTTTTSPTTTAPPTTTTLPPTTTTTTTTTSTTTTTTTPPTTTTTTPAGGTDPNPITLGSSWRHQAIGNETPGWQQPGFDDSEWPAIATEAGFGDGDEATTLTRNLGGRGLITAYFRQSFNVGSPSAVSGATLSLLADDGAVVWLNGQRVVNDNMTSGPVGYSTLSLSGRWGSAERTVRTFTLDPGALVDGTNVLAIEVHQREEWSSDLSFDAALALDLDGPPPPPTTTTTAPPTTTTTPPPTTTTTPPVGTDEWVRTEWPHAFVSTSTGAPLVLEGVNLRDVIDQNGRRIDTAGIQRIADEGFDSIRLVLDWPDFEPAPGQWNETAFSGLSTLLADARAAGLMVVLDPVHLKGPGYGGSSMYEVPAWVWAQAPAQTTFASAEQVLLQRVGANVGPYLTEMATRFGSDPNVIAIDLVSELRAWPPISTNGGVSAQNLVLDVYADLIDAVRAVDADQVLLIEPVYGNSHPAQLDLGRLTATQRTNLVYSIHDYFAGGDDDGYTAQGATDAGFHTWDGFGGYPLDQISRSTLQSQLAASVQRHLDVLAPWQVPLYIGEYGISPDAPFAAEWIADKRAVFDTAIDTYDPTRPAAEVALPRAYWTWTYDGRFGLVPWPGGPASALLPLIVG